MPHEAKNDELKWQGLPEALARSAVAADTFYVYGRLYGTNEWTRIIGHKTSRADPIFSTRHYGHLLVTGKWARIDDWAWR